MRATWGIAASSLFLAACAMAPRLQVLPALTPVDAARPHFIYPAVQGTACGAGAEARAMEDLFRLSGVDGFVTAVISQEAKKDGCVTVTAHPITYGCTPKSFGPSAHRQPMQVVPGPEKCDAASSDTCALECSAFAARLGSGEFETNAFKNRCLFRCQKPDAAFMTCVRGVSSALDVRRCDSAP